MRRMDLGIAGKAALVTAASKGLGLATATALAAEGCRVAINSRDRERLAAAAAKIPGAAALPGDVTDPATPARLVEETVDRLGAIDILVANAGGPPRARALELDDEALQAALNANLLTSVRLVRAAVPHMRAAGWGRIVLITSSAVKQPIPDLILSNAVRAGVVGLVKSMANEFGKDGITFNNVGPGYTATERLKSLAATRALAAGLKPEDMYDKWSADTPLKRIAEPQEVADAMVWLASERASYITGQSIAVDGGWIKSLL